MIRALARSVLVALLVVSAALSAVGVTIDEASAQVDVVGTADFRNAPALAPGQYSDRIVSGDTAWYALVYTNETPYRFEVSIPGLDLTTSDELTLTASFVAPTLEPVGEQGSVISGSGAAYPSGATNVWFLKVTLDTTGTPGVEYRILIDVEGVESTGFGDCTRMPDCTFDDEIAVLDAQTETAEAELAELLAGEQAADLELEITNLNGFAESAEGLLPAAEARLARAEAQMAKLCAPDAMCSEFPDPGSKVPIVGWIAGGMVLLAGALRAVSKLRATDDDEVTVTAPAGR